MCDEWVWKTWVEIRLAGAVRTAHKELLQVLCQRKICGCRAGRFRTYRIKLQAGKSTLVGAPKVDVTKVLQDAVGGPAWFIGIPCQSAFDAIPQISLVFIRNSTYLTTLVDSTSHVLWLWRLAATLQTARQ